MLDGVPSLASIHIYPVKAAKGRALTWSHVEPWGLAGDRRWLVVDNSGKFCTQRELHRLALLSAVAVDGRLELSAEGHGSVAVPVPAGDELTTVTVWRSTVSAAVSEGADAWLSEFLDKDVRLVYLDDPTRRAINPDYARPGETVSFADGYPLLLASADSLAALNGWLDEQDHPALPMNRFRPNVVVSGFPAWAEDEWTLLRIGEVEFRSVKPCDRCVVTTIDQDTGEKGREPLRVLARHRQVDQKVFFGQNLIPNGPGTISVGDEVEILG